jgi:glutathione synthase/RimK-type ligase-like ATP-grasp enzyme
VAPTIPTVSHGPVRIDQIDVIWWRRFYVDPQISSEVSDPDARDLIVRDGRAAFLGALLAEFKGRWVSEPDASRRAEMKPLQLVAARRVGLAVPRTLISQDPSAIRQFVADVGAVVAKPVTGTPNAQIYTGLIDGAMLRHDRQLALCPAIYQEYVPGTHHLRVCCFGERCHSALITSSEVDWRGGPIEARPIETPRETERALREVLDLMGLRMGIVDMKLTDDGRPVWLELNPQGQFLFLEGLCDMQLTRRFGEFLVNEARKQVRSHHSGGAAWASSR